MTSATKSAFLDAITDLADDLSPGSEVRSYVFLTQDPLGFAFDVKPEDRTGVAQKMRELADAIERGD